MNIRSYAQLINVLETLKANLGDYLVQVGATVNDETFVSNSLENLIYVQNYLEVLDANKKAYTAVKQRLYNGLPGLIPDGPVTAPFDPPFPLNGDVHGEVMKLIMRFKGAAGYTHEIGVALGIAGDAPEPPDPGTLKLTLEAFPGEDGYRYTLVVGERGNVKMWGADVQSVGGSTWTDVGRFDGKAENLTYNPGAGVDGPVQIKIRVRPFKDGAYVGLFSDTVTITVNP